MKTYKVIENGIEYEVVERSSGTRFWFRGNVQHRESGPAYERCNGECSWYLNDEKIPCMTQEDFEKYMRLKAFW